MSRLRSNPGGSLLTCIGLLTLALSVEPGLLPAQELSLKRTVPGSEGFSCPAADPLPEPSQEERVEALRLGSNADQALILGDRQRALDLLARATEMDPTSPELTYRHARLLEEMDAGEAAIAKYCRVLALGPESEGIEDAGARLRAILDSQRAGLSEDAIAAFEDGLSAVDAGDLRAALASFTSARDQAPGWAEAVYNRGIVHARLGQPGPAAADLEDYLSLSPDANDVLLVSQRIGQLRSLGTLPRPAAALTLGLLFPGAGQFYSGRAWGGITVLSLSAGAAAAGILIEEVSVRCVGSVPGESCPPDRVIGEETDRPYLVHGLVAAGAVAFIGAVESFFRARGRRSREAGALIAMDAGRSRVVAPALAARGTRLSISWVQVTF
jgi:tetratricopeptide (TPR) repeat protein